MPQQSVYIREEDMPKWKAVKKKAELVHFLLTLSDFEIDTIIKVREQRARAIRLPAGHHD